MFIATSIKLSIIYNNYIQEVELINFNMAQFKNHLINAEGF